MDVGDVSTGNSGIVQLASKVDTAITKMAMDNSKQNAKAMLEVMDASTKQLERLAKPNLGANIDVSV
jgi:hypothetical protein